MKWWVCAALVLPWCWSDGRLLSFRFALVGPEGINPGALGPNGPVRLKITCLTLLFPRA